MPAEPPVPTPGTLKRYRLTEADWRGLWEAQGGRCALCGKPPRTRLVIDHCHKTGRVRGLLCPLDNGKLGKIRDDADWARNAAEYLDNPPAYSKLDQEPRSPRGRRRKGGNS